MKPIHCEICGEACAEFNAADLIARTHSNDHAAQVSLKDILAAAAVSEKCLIILRDFYDENERVKFIVK